MDNYIKCLKQTLQWAHARATKIIEKIKLRNKIYHDEKAKPLNVKINDKVSIKAEPYNKHGPKYKGPFEIVEIDEPNLVTKTDKRIS